MLVIRMRIVPGKDDITVVESKTQSVPRAKQHQDGIGKEEQEYGRDNRDRHHQEK
jgi:hypothetical protein